MPLNISFNLTPQEALKFFRDKGFKTSFDWREMLHQEHDRAFTVAKMMDLDLLADIKKAVDKALAEGQTLKEFKAGLTPLLQKKGWWGRKEVLDPLTGEIKMVQLGSPRRLRTIFETNLKTAYSAGHWEQIQKTKKSAPWLMYDAINDGRTRPQHLAWDNTILKINDPWWRSHYPPNGWNCRCGVIQLSDGDLKEMGLKPTKAPKLKKKKWVNERTGEILNLPEGIDPGWAYHVGRDRGEDILTPLAKKIESAPHAFSLPLLEKFISSSGFKSWYEQPKGSWPVLKLDEKAAKAINAKMQVAVMSESTIIKNKKNHPDLTLEEYLVLPAMGATPTLIIREADNKIIIIKLGVKYYMAAIKAAQEGGRETFVTSFRKTNRRNIESLLQRGTLIEGKWK